MTVGAGRWSFACTLAKADESEITPVSAGGVQLVLVRDGERLRAFERACPHEAADLAKGRLCGGRLFCPRHLASFGLEDGRVSPGWSTAPLRRYPVRVERDGIYVDVTGSSAAPASGSR